MGILKPLKKNEFQTVALKLSKTLHERLRAVQDLANEADLEFDVNDLLVPLLEKAVAKAEKELERLDSKPKVDSKEPQKINTGGSDMNATKTADLNQPTPSRI